MVPQPPKNVPPLLPGIKLQLRPSFAERLDEILAEHMADVAKRFQARADAVYNHVLNGTRTMEKARGIKTLDDLGAAAGIDKAEMSNILAEIKENHRKLRTCTRHQFKEAERVFGKRATCVHCGGTMTCESIAWYEGGVEAGRTVAAGPTWI